MTNMKEERTPKIFVAQAKIFWDGKTGGRIKIGRRAEVKVDIPREFGGLGRYSCPDELFIASVASCLLTTLLYFKEKMRLRLLSLSVEGSGDIEKKGSNGYELKKVRFKISIAAKKEYERMARECVELAEEYCHLSKLLSKLVNVEINKVFRFS